MPFLLYHSQNGEIERDREKVEGSQGKKGRGGRGPGSVYAAKYLKFIQTYKCALLAGYSV